MLRARYPVLRPRRLRRRAALRRAAADVTLPRSCLVCPLFVGAMDQPREVASMPGVRQWPVEAAVKRIEALHARGLEQFMLFGVTAGEHKTADGRFAADPRAPVNRVLAEVRRRGLDVVMHADLCLCEYTTHGHCGLLEEGGRASRKTEASQKAAGASPRPRVDNDATLEVLGETAVAQARAGADVVAPSGMMDGQVAAVRAALDQEGWSDTAILSYSIKYASSLYGPFREAGEGGMAFGDRRGYQMDFRRSREWRTELEADLAEGADMVMVKPAMAYLDIVARVREATAAPLAAYHVSGEYAMVHAAAQRGWADLRQAALEHTFAIRRAGADLIVTYFAPQLLEWGI